MAKKHIDLTKAQKDEIRRLTQLANRRIKSAEKAYRKEGMEVLPYEVVGDYQIKEKWSTNNTPISRSVKFESQKDYRRHLHELRRFELSRPGIKEYSEIQREKTITAVETSLGVAPPDELIEKINKMNAPQLAKFWKTYSKKSAKLGVRYSSLQAMLQALSEHFNEALDYLSR